MEAVTRQHASVNTVFHCLYGYYNLGISRSELGRLYHKSERTITNWIHQYEETGTFQRARHASDRKYNQAHRRWLIDYYTANPLSYLDEAEDAFNKAHDITITKTSVWRIIHEYGMTWKVLERRAMHIKDRDVNRFIKELSMIDWSHHNLTFLDEVAFDNRGMLRKRGYAMRGETVAIRGDFQRKPRVSMLAFIGVDGLVDYYHTEGTFDRIKFVTCCKDFVYSKRSNLRMYPGPRSVWILDGASIHRDKNIINYLRRVGVVAIFLPAYCPFFNPIEYLFGFIKKAFQREYQENSKRDLLPFITKIFQRFESYDMSRVFEHCGWKKNGAFDAVGPLAKEKRRVPFAAPSSDEDDSTEYFGFHDRSNQ